MNKPIDQRTPGTPDKSAAPVQRDEKSNTQPFYKANTLPKQGADHGPGKDKPQAQKAPTQDPLKAGSRAANDSNARTGQEPKKS